MVTSSVASCCRLQAALLRCGRVGGGIVPLGGILDQFSENPWAGCSKCCPSILSCQHTDVVL